MKKLKCPLLFIIILFNCFIIVPINAQIINEYGIKSGMAYASHTWGYLNFDTQTNPNFLTGISARAFADFLNTSYFNIEAEIGFSQKGANLNYYNLLPRPLPNGDVDFPPTDEFTTTQNRLNYVNVSLMGKIKYEFGIFAPYLLLGPQFNYLVGKDIGQNGYETMDFRNGKGHLIFPIDPIYNRLYKDIWGFSTGLGSVIKLLRINLLVEYRFEKDITYNYNESPIFRNYSHSFLIGVQL
ncbi:MAG: outer membrane beta-barrel protein [Syntrophomonadaceae bacterium]